MAEKKERTFDSPEELDEFMSGDPTDGEAETGLYEADDLAPPPVKGAKKKAVPEPREELMDIPEMPDDKDDRLEENMLDIAADVPVQVVAVMGKKNVTIKEIAAFRMGEIIELGRPANEVVDLVAGGKLIARGELVEIEGKLGVRIIKMMR